MCASIEIKGISLAKGRVDGSKLTNFGIVRNVGCDVGSLRRRNNTFFIVWVLDQVKLLPLSKEY